MPVKYLRVYLLFCVVSISTGQQLFQRNGDHYNARVAIRRLDHLPIPQSQYDSNRFRQGPWRQGDRITKQELIQNLARALLARKTVTDEMLNEKKKDNERKLYEYALYQAKLAKEASEPHPQPHPATGPVQHATIGNNKFQAYQGSLSQVSSNNVGMLPHQSQAHGNIVEIGHIQPGIGNQQRQINSQQLGNQQPSSMHVQSRQFIIGERQPAQART